MTDLAIFIFGAFVTLLVSGTLGLLWWAAIEDGRYNREYHERRSSRSALNSNDPQKVQQR